MRRALLLPFALLLIAQRAPDCPVTTRYCVEIGSAWEEPLLTIARRDGTVVRKLAKTDLFTANDAQSLSLRFFEFDAVYRGETLLVRVPTRSKDGSIEEIRIDLASGSVTRPEHDIFPAPRVWAAPTDRSTTQPKEHPPCVTADVARITSGELLARATAQPVPKYPNVALKARITGTTVVEVVVAENGDVLCTRVTKPLPFGMDAAAESAAREWTFQPASGKVMGEITFHFDRVPWDFRP